MATIKEYLEESELGTYQKVFPDLTVPVIESQDADGYLKAMTLAAIEQVKYLETFSGIPLEVLYENIGQRHRASNALALSMLRKKSQDSGSSRGGLDLIDIPDDLVAGDYSNAFLPVKADTNTKPKLLSGLLSLLNVIGLAVPETRALSIAVDLVESWLLDSGILRELGMSIVDNLIEGLVSLVVQKIIGKETIVIGDGSAALVPYVDNIAKALTEANYKEEALALVDAFGTNGELVKQTQAIKQQLADCCPKEALDDIATVFKAAKWKEFNEQLTTSWKDFELSKEFVLSNEDSSWKKFYDELLQMLRDLAYKTETLEIGGIRLALRATIIHEQ